MASARSHHRDGVFSDRSISATQNNSRITQNIIMYDFPREENIYTLSCVQISQRIASHWISVNTSLTWLWDRFWKRKSTLLALEKHLAHDAHVWEKKLTHFPKIPNYPRFWVAAGTPISAFAQNLGTPDDFCCSWMGFCSVWGWFWYFVEWWVLADQGENALSRGHPNADSARDVWPFRRPLVLPKILNINLPCKYWQNSMVKMI